MVSFFSMEFGQHINLYIYISPGLSLTLLPLCFQVTDKFRNFFPIMTNSKRFLFFGGIFKDISISWWHIQTEFYFLVTHSKRFLFLAVSNSVYVFHNLSECVFICFSSYLGCFVGSLSSNLISVASSFCVNCLFIVRVSQNIN